MTDPTILRAAFVATVICIASVGIATADDPARSEQSSRAVASTTPQTSDPLAGTVPMSPAVTGADVEQRLATTLPPRTDSPADWDAGVEPLHYCGEPRVLPPCVPPPPCHPTQPPHPLDLVGVRGAATCGPTYRGPCSPRTGTHDNGPLPRVHRLHDRAFDWFYRPK